MLFVSSYSDEKLIAMIRSCQESERNKALKYCYNNKDWRNMVKAHVLQYYGNEQDVDDVFQDTIVILDNNIRNNRFEGRSSLKTFFFSICKWRWYTIRRSTKRIALTDDTKRMDTDDLKSPEVLMLAEEKKNIVQQLLNTLGETCRRILELYQLDYSMEEIAQDLGIAYQTAKNNTHNCRKVFREKLEKQPELMKNLR
jgi:RNA polymerase sigma factor (sigma-70 family)